MKILGYEFSFRKAQPTLMPPQGAGMGNWFGIIAESFTGAWQRNVEIRVDNVLTFSALYACVTLIASDIGKLRIRLMEEKEGGVEQEVDIPAFSPVLRKPNRYQTRIKFIEQWMTSKLIHGNAYVLKERDERKTVRRLYVLDPLVTKPLIANDGSVYYQLSTNFLAGIDEKEVVVPASEIIHDANTPLYHPLVGVSPITACGLAAVQGLAIQNNSAKFFENGSRPGGVLTAPARIDDATAKRIKDHWDNNFTGANAGKIAVLGDGLEYSAMSVSAVDAELIKQLSWTAENVCTAFHVPAYMIGVGPPPNYNNIEALNQQYYSQCLQSHIESIELLLDEGLGLDQRYETEFDLDDLLRMDTANRITGWGNLVSRGIAAPNEAREDFGLPPVKGGEMPYLQQQNFSLEALAQRDESGDPFGKKPPPAAQATQPVAAPAPQKLLAPPSLDWSTDACLKGIRDAAA